MGNRLQRASFAEVQVENVCNNNNYNYDQMRNITT